MKTSIAEEEGRAQAPATSEKPKVTKKARGATRRTNVAPKKAKSAREASTTKTAPTGAKRANAARDGSKTAKVLDLLKRPSGAYGERTDESYWLAAAFSPGVPVRYHRQEDGPDRNVHQGAGRRAQLLGKNLNHSYSHQTTPPGWYSAAFLVSLGWFSCDRSQPICLDLTEKALARKRAVRFPGAGQWPIRDAGRVTR
jgi:hypothetical protein